MVNYSNAKIYKLVAKDDLNNDNIYVGSTCNPLNKRFSQHKLDSSKEQRKNFKVYQHFNRIGWENVCIILLYEYKACENKEQLLAKEREYLKILKLI